MGTSIDRRKFLTYTGVAGAATGAAWVAPSVLGSSDAFAIGSTSSCPYAGVLHWSDATWASGGTGDDSWTGGDLQSPGIPVAPDNSSDGAHKSFVAKVGGTGSSFVWVKVTVTAIGPPATNPQGTGGPKGPPSRADSYALFSTTASVDPKTDSGSYEVGFEFFSDSTLQTPTTVSNISFDIIDIDGTENDSSWYWEQIWLTGAGSVTRSVNANITGSGTVGAPWHNTSASPNLSGAAGTITVSIPSATSFTVHGTSTGAGAHKDHGWLIGELTWGCAT